MHIKDKIMMDKVEKWQSSLLQHGKYNNRIYLMKLAKTDAGKIIPYLDRIADENEYTKIIAKVPDFARYEFEKNGYLQEAYIPQFYHHQNPVYFMAKYLDDRRMLNPNIDHMKKVLQTAKTKSALISDVQLARSFQFHIATEKDIPQMVQVYKKVFETYPFPIHDPQYLIDTMHSHIKYFLITRGKQVVAIASAEIDYDGKNVEMTDFATLPEYRGMGFALYLLYQMEAVMEKTEIRSFNTIARAMSYGMNITFAKRGYKYSGTLLNNTNISGKLESMNIWYKII